MNARQKLLASKVFCLIVETKDIDGFRGSHDFVRGNVPLVRIHLSGLDG